MRNPWKIALAEMYEPWSKVPCLILMAIPIPNAIEGQSSTMFNVLGLGKDGNHYRFVVTSADFETANRNAVSLLQCDDIIAPKARVTEARLVSLP